MSSRRAASTAHAEFSTGGASDLLTAGLDRLVHNQRSETAAYVATMAAELAQIAAQAQLDTLSYLLTMARLEADTEARRA